MYGFCKTKLQNSLLDVFSENELPEYSNIKILKNIHKINQPWV